VLELAAELPSKGRPVERLAHERNLEAALYAGDDMPSGLVDLLRELVQGLD